ncbi:MAG: hypothetical protein ACTSSE_17075 [Candidatus Thorarchaeota archaeon]
MAKSDSDYSQYTHLIILLHQERATSKTRMRDGKPYEEYLERVGMYFPKRGKKS